MPRVEEKLDVRVVVEDARVVFLLPRKMSDLVIPWQQARTVGEVLVAAAGDVPYPPKVVDPATVKEETEQVRINTHKGRYVVLLFPHADRVYFSPTAAVIVGNALRKKAQDLELLARGIRLKGVK